MRRLSLDQLCKILNHVKWGKKLGIEYSDCAWSIGVDKGVVHGYTSMDNFDMREFLDKIGVNPDAVRWSEYGDFGEEDDVPDCDPDCEDCQMRFVCYTNRE